VFWSFGSPHHPKKKMGWGGSEQAANLMPEVPEAFFLVDSPLGAQCLATVGHGMASQSCPERPQIEQTSYEPDSPRASSAGSRNRPMAHFQTDDQAFLETSILVTGLPATHFEG
jgi:hypothetical protein